MDMNEFLKLLTCQTGISGFERGFAEMLGGYLDDFCDEVKIDRGGSVFGIKRAKAAGAKTIMLDAHLDRIGLIVSGTDENGFVTFDTIGGADERILPASEVYILGRERVFGVIGAKPPHLIKKTDKSESEGLSIKDMLIDTGLDGETARRLIRVGDPILMKSDFLPLLGGRVSSGALDNRAGIAAVFGALERTREIELPYNLLISFTAGEEQGLHGAYTAHFDEMPDFAVVVDVTHGETPDSPKDFTSFPLGGGAVICRGPNLRYDLTNQIIAIAKENDIPYKTEVAAGCSGTNAWAFQTAAGGIPCALISVPLKYMHTTVETVDLKDAETVACLLEKIVSGGVELA